MRFAEEKSIAAAIEFSGSEHMGRTLIIERTKEGGAGGAGGAPGAPVK